ncbi:hypothetical protein [Insolitispirillum peregrinum]|uniref:Uncharacterized protein n=1 Tax=Insolitispirillum peregrinum TaxID=80876 RepID=A0A1N7L7A3_9PROT|nr:hypothetical protein [Insolitispirillum peregrinum]SIS69704.1 hypothetical protein SAMN05421779_103154 [Insolitispirillum peregrinum]
MCSTEIGGTPENTPVTKTPVIAPVSAVATADIARKAEHRCLSALSTRALHTATLEVTRPSVTNSPDGGHDIDVVGSSEEVKELVGTMTGIEPEKLKFLGSDTNTGKINVRIDVKSGKTVSADMIDNHAANSSRSPTFHVHLLLFTNPELKITKEAQKKLSQQKDSFENIGVLIDVVQPEGLKRIETENKARALSADHEASGQSESEPK